jgi:quinoprotein glucose dehydrogenase
MGSRIDQDNFRRLVASGRGDMPGFPGLNSRQLDQLFAYLTNSSGNGRRFAFRGPARELGGPVVGSGGAPGGLVQDFSMAEIAAKYPGKFAGPPYPEGVQAPVRMYTDYGLDFPYVIGPPWSALAAYDLNKGTIVWDVPLGENTKAIQNGASEGPGVITGAMHRGTIVTSTGLLFVNCADAKLRAYDAETGKILWTYQLPTGTQGIPALYEVNGREYLVDLGRDGIFAGIMSSGQNEAEIAKRAYIAFALPQ